MSDLLSSKATLYPINSTLIEINSLYTVSRRSIARRWISILTYSMRSTHHKKVTAESITSTVVCRTLSIAHSQVSKQNEETRFSVRNHLYMTSRGIDAADVMIESCLTKGDSYAWNVTAMSIEWNYIMES